MPGKHNRPPSPPPGSLGAELEERMRESRGLLGDIRRERNALQMDRQRFLDAEKRLVDLLKDIETQAGELTGAAVSAMRRVAAAEVGRFRERTDEAMEETRRLWEAHRQQTEGWLDEIIQEHLTRTLSLRTPEDLLGLIISALLPGLFAKIHETRDSLAEVIQAANAAREHDVTPSLADLLGTDSPDTQVIKIHKKQKPPR